MQTLYAGSALAELGCLNVGKFLPTYFSRGYIVPYQGPMSCLAMPLIDLQKKFSDYTFVFHTIHVKVEQAFL